MLIPSFHTTWNSTRFRIGFVFLCFAVCIDFERDYEPEVVISPAEQERIRKMMEQTAKPVINATVDSSQFQQAINRCKFPSGGVVPKEGGVRDGLKPRIIVCEP